MSKKFFFSAALFWIVLFLINFGHGAGWSGVYAILIKKIGSDNLAHFFLYSAIGGFILNLCLMFFADVLSNEKLVQFSFVSFILILAADLFVLSSEAVLPIGLFKVLLIGLAVLIIAVPSVFIIQTWNLINKTYTPKSGANIYPILSTAPLIGSIFGGAAAQHLPHYFTTEILIYTWGICIFIAVIATFVLNRVVEKINLQPVHVNKKELINNFKAGFKHYKISAFARDLSVVFMSFWLVCTIIDYCYAVTLEKTYATPEQMASFYGIYTKYVNFSALMVQLFLGSKLLKKIGVRNGFLFLPTSQIIGFGILIFTPGLAPIVAMMFMQTLIGMSVQSNSVQVSFNVFAASVRGKIRTLLEGVINPLGGVIGALTIMGITQMKRSADFSVEQILPFAGLIFAGIWLFFTFRIRKSYLDEIKWTYAHGSDQDKKDAKEALDIESNALFSTNDKLAN